MWRFGGALGFTLLVMVSCSGEQVALNERLSDASSTTSEGGGCTLFELGDNGATTSSANALGFVVTQTLQGDHVVVSVTNGSNLVTERRYDEFFFKAETVDQFIAPSDAGTALMLRYWGKFHPGGLQGCTPLSQDGP
jgi:hypothetical protein